jgi:hypothetical protein
MTMCFSIYFICIGWQHRTNMTLNIIGGTFFGPANVGGTNWHMFVDCGEILFLSHHPGSTFISFAPMVFL